MKLIKTVLAFAMSIAILSGCSSTDEKQGSLLEGVQNGANDVSTSGYADGSQLSGDQFGTGDTSTSALGYDEFGVNTLGPEFKDPANPLSKQTIYFMYDSSQVRQDFIPVIASHAQYLVSHPAQRIILGGHADERGSSEYNIALGEQRSKSVYRMMRVQGVSDNQLELVSYGEEKPVADGMDEASWQQNRRVELIYQAQ
ncbi:MAG: peptidoglycan-associated lipoprotein Pal [Methylococcaceae bacterium]